MQDRILQTQQQPNYQQLYQQEKTKVKQLKQQLELEKIKFKKVASNKIKGKICPICLQQTKQEKQSNFAHLKQDLIGFSSKINTVLQKQSKVHASSQAPKGKLKRMNTFNVNQTNHTENIPSRKEDKHALSMIDNFTIFGVCQENIKSNNDKLKNEGLEPQLLYSFKPPSDIDQQASKLIFPSGIALKNVLGQKAKDKAIQMMSFCYTNLKSFVLRFRCQQYINSQQYEKNPFLMHLNPEKALFCICIGISDYTTVNNNQKYNFLKKNCSLGIIQEQSPTIKYKPPQQIFTPQQAGSNSMGQQTTGSFPSQKSSSSQEPLCKITMSQRVFCISSYYPFFSFYQQILRNLINIVKMQRLMIYKHKSEDIKQTDSLFQLERMKQLFSICMHDLNSKKVIFNRSYQLKLINQQKLTLLTDWNLAKTYFIEDWVFSIINMFNVDTFIDVLTLVMLQDRVVFICENSHILTYTIYLFSSILLKPFIYAFEIVSIIPQQDFLGAPFPVIYGMLKKRKYFNQSNIFQTYKNTYIFLGPDKVQIIYTENKKHLTKCKPQKLKNDLTPVFKDLKKYRKPEKSSTKYQIMEVSEYAMSSMIEQRQIAVQIVQRVNQYILKDIVTKLPNQIQINNLKNSIDPESIPSQKDQHSYLMDQIKLLVRKNIKDPFIDKLMETQMMSVYTWK